MHNNNKTQSSLGIPYNNLQVVYKKEIKVKDPLHDAFYSNNFCIYRPVRGWITCYITIKGTEHSLSGTYKNITEVMMTIDQHLCAPLNKEN